MIPPAIELTDIEVVEKGDGLYAIEATLPPTTHYCSIDCAIDGSSYYAPTLLGTYAPSDTARRITINHPFGNLLREGYSPLFAETERVALRLNSLDAFAFAYWRKWEDNFINSLNPIFPSTSNLPTNISNGGIGIWSGYGTSYYKIGVIGEWNL